MLKKWLRKLFKKREKTTIYHNNRKDIVESVTCLCLFSVDNKSGKKSFIMRLNEDENLDSENEANKLFENIRNEKKMDIYFYNYRSNELKYYNKTNGTVTKTTLKPLTNYPVDLKVVYAAIEIVSSDYKSHQLHPKYFSIIFKLLKDKVLGTDYEDVKATYFRQELMKDYKTEGRSSFSKYLPHGFYPNWYYEESQFTSDKKKHIKEALEFAEKFKTTYDDIRFKNNVNCTEKVETAEETAE